jgi:hypothetical protein
MTQPTVAATGNTAPPATSPPVALVELPSSPPPGEPVVPGDTAQDLRDASSCDPAAPTVGAVTLSWLPVGTGDQLVAVAARKNGFDTGNYGVTESLSPGVATYAVRGVQAGGVYYWRVMTRVPTGWTASPAVTFTGPTCVLDRPAAP